MSLLSRRRPLLVTTSRWSSPAPVLLAAVLWGCTSAAGPGRTPVHVPPPVAEDPRAPALPGELLVTLQPHLPTPWIEVIEDLEGRYSMQQVGSWPIRVLGVRCVLFHTERPTQELLARLRDDPRVESAQANYVFLTRGLGAAVPAERGDPYLHLQYARELMGLDTVADLATGRGVRVAIVDTGAEVDHPDLDRHTRLVNFVADERGSRTEAHGTAIAGIIGARTDNGLGIAGVAPEVALDVLRACWKPPQLDQAVCSSYTLALALDSAALRRYDVLNLSLAGPADPLLFRLLAAVLNGGTVVIAAEPPPGEEGRIAFPSSAAGVIVVGACGPGGKPPPDLGPRAGDQLVAPGVEVLSLAPGGTYEFYSGSSVAAAHVTGVAALVLQRSPKLGPAGVERVLRETAWRSAASAASEVVDACAAVSSASATGIGAAASPCRTSARAQPSDASR